MTPLKTPNPDCSVNFEFMRPHAPLEFDTLHKAEFLLHLDPCSTLLRLRQFGETFCKRIHAGFPALPSLHEKMRGDGSGPYWHLLEIMKGRCLSETDYKTLDGIRLVGNKAAHELVGDIELAKHWLKEAYQLCKRWAKRQNIGGLPGEFLDPTDHSKTIIENPILKEELDKIKRSREQEQENDRLLEALWPRDEEEAKQRTLEEIRMLIDETDLALMPTDIRMMLQDDLEDIRQEDRLKIEEMQTVFDRNVRKHQNEKQELKRAYEGKLESVAKEAHWTQAYPVLESSDEPDWNKIPKFMETRLLEGQPPFPQWRFEPRNPERGSWGRAYKLYPAGGGLPVMVKIPTEQTKHSPEQIRNTWERETRAVKQLASAIDKDGIRGIAKPLQYPKSTKHAGYVIYEHCPGETLARRLEKSKLPLLVALRVTSELCNTLFQLAAADIAYTDIKPDNIIIGRDARVMLIDPVPMVPGHVDSPPEWLAMANVEQLYSNPNRPAFQSGQAYLLTVLLLNMITGPSFLRKIPLQRSCTSPMSGSTLTVMETTPVNEAQDQLGLLQAAIYETIEESTIEIMLETADANARVRWQKKLETLLWASVGPPELRAEGLRLVDYQRELDSIIDPMGIIRATSRHA